MRSATSCSKAPRAWFNPTLFRKNWTRFWPIWTLYGVIWFLILTVGIVNSYGGSGAEGYYPTGMVIDVVPFGVFFSPVFGVLAAMAVFSYLYNSRAAGLMHTLPIRREGLFLTNYLSGLSFFLVPILVVALLSLAAQSYAGHGIDATALFVWAWCQSIMSLFFYSFAVFCAMFTGHILALPAFYAILNALVFVLYWLFTEMADQFLFGFTRNSSSGLHELILWLTPVQKLGSSLGDTGSPDYSLTGLLSIFVYGLAGLILAGLALAVYRRRHIETAGDVVSVNWVRPVFKYGVALCSAVTLGSFLWNLFMPGAYAQRSVWYLLLFMLVMGLIGYFVAEMLLRKNFRVFRSAWKGGLCFAAALVLAACAMEFDLLGYESRVPDPALVARVSVNADTRPYDDASYGPGALTDPQLIAQATEFHQSILREKNTIESGSWEEHLTEVALAADRDDVEAFRTVHVNLSYLLLDGGTLERSYRIPVTQEYLDDPGTPAARLDDLINAPGLSQSLYFSSVQEDDILVSAQLTGGAQDEFLTSELRDELYAAVQSDLAAGRLGRRYLLENRERQENCYHNDLVFQFYRPGRDQKTDNGFVNRNGNYSITVTPQITATDTLAVLEKAGLSDLLRTHTQFIMGK